MARPEDLYGWSGQDLYYQRLWVDMSQGQRVVMLADDRVNTLNIPVFTTAAFDGSMLGIARTVARNEFLVGFTYATEGSGNGDIMGVLSYGSPPVSVDDAPLADGFRIHPSAPNPFAGSTTIRFSTPSPGFVTVKASNMMGHTVATLLHGTLSDGDHAMTWDTTNDAWFDLPAGVNVFGVRFDGRVASERITPIRWRTPTRRASRAYLPSGSATGSRGFCVSHLIQTRMTLHTILRHRAPLQPASTIHRHHTP